MNTNEVYSRKQSIHSESDLAVGYLDLFKEDLHAKRYEPETIRHYVTAARAFFCWLANHNIVAVDVSKETIRRYVCSLERVATSSARKFRLPHSGVGLKHLLETLHKHGIANPPEPAISTTAADHWLHEYDYFLDHVLV